MMSILWIWILEEKSGRAHTTEVGTMELSHIDPMPMAWSTPTEADAILSVSEERAISSERASISILFQEYRRRTEQLSEARGEETSRLLQRDAKSKGIKVS